MTVKHLPKQIDTVIVGNGPSALILSYILHGYIPYYDPSTPHPDPILHQKLSKAPCLLEVNTEDLTAHFDASRFSYSSQALPINVLLDTLLRPLADTNPGEHKSCVKWRFEEGRRRDYIVVGNTAHAGGQWADNPVSASWDIGTLSYAEMLSLPGYTFEEHYKNIYDGKALPDFHRPTRREVADYLSTYPKAAAIKDAVYTGVMLGGFSRTKDGFHIASHDINCNNLVLASGTFSDLIPARPLLRPLKALPAASSPSDAPLLVIGSGFTAADIIISASADRKIVHIYKWDPENHPSPLRACHRSAYPEYANVYKKMKLAASRTLGAAVVSPFPSKKGDPLSEHDVNYEGLPNTYIRDVRIRDGSATIWLQTGDGRAIKREISNIEYVIGRRGSLTYLDERIRSEILDPSAALDGPISGQTLRQKVEKSTEVAPNIFAIGSLTGDSLIRYAYGGCVMAAGKIFEHPDQFSQSSQTTNLSPEVQKELDDTREVLRKTIDSVLERGSCPPFESHVDERTSKLFYQGAKKQQSFWQTCVVS